MLRTALPLAQSLSYFDGVARSSEMLADLLLSQGDSPNEAIRFWKNSMLALEKCGGIGPIVKRSKLSGKIAETMEKSSNFSEAFKILKKRVPLVRLLGVESEEAQLLSKMGKIVSKLGDNVTSITYFQQASKLFSELKMFVEHSKTFVDMGVSFKHAGNELEARKFALLAKQTSEYFSEEMGGKYDALASFLTHEKKILEQKLSDSEIAEDPTSLATSKLHLGILLFEEKKLEESTNLQTEALHGFLRLRDLHNVQKTYGSLSKILEEKKDFKFAQLFLQKQLATAEKCNDLSDVCNALADLSHVCLLNGDFENCISFIHKHNALCFKLGNRNLQSMNTVAKVTSEIQQRSHK